MLVRLSLLGLLGLAGCGTGQPEPSEAGREPATDQESDLRDYVGKDALVDQALLQFSEPERRRFETARACFAKRGASWEHFPLRKIGNFIEEDWCRGERAHLGCSGGGFRDAADVEWAGVGTLHYDSEWPEVFGVQIDLGRRAPTGWSVRASVSSDGRTVLGDGTHVDFERVGIPDDAIHLGSSYQYTVAENVFSVGAGGDPWAVLERLRSSPAALTKEGVAHWRELEAEVVTMLVTNGVVECVYGEYQGDGIPPECERKVALTPERVATEVQSVQAQVGRIVELLESESVALHAALVALAPTECVIP